MGAYAFISYQTDDKLVAREIKNILERIGVESFLAHEDIDVSEEWRVKILDEIASAKIFISILSKRYFSSAWCVQESGIAAYRKNLTIIPLSIDGTTPRGFITYIQSTKVEPGRIIIDDLLPGLIKQDFKVGTDAIIEIIGRSGDFRSAEKNFQRLLPHIEELQDEQYKKLLEYCASNDQIHHAWSCAQEYIPPLLKSHGYLLDTETRELLGKTCKQYSGNS